MEYPFAVGISADRVVLASWFTGTVQLLDRTTNKTLAMSHGWKAPYDALPMADGSVLVAEIATGNITQRERRRLRHAHGSSPAGSPGRCR